MKAELDRRRAENERLKQRDGRAISMKVSEKGGLSLYGLGRFPVTLYEEQWVKLLDMADDIRAFVKGNESKLKSKGDDYRLCRSVTELNSMTAREDAQLDDLVGHRQHQRRHGGGGGVHDGDQGIAEGAVARSRSRAARADRRRGATHLWKAAKDGTPWAGWSSRAWRTSG